jgi:RecA/RadA recombinase
MTNPLLEKIKKNSTIKQTATINESKVFGKKTQVETDVPIINLALSGEFDGGLSPGILQIAGQSKHFKSGFAMLIASSFLRKYADGIVLFYDSEFGTPESYFTNFDVDVNRVIHTPITNIEELKFDIVNQLKNIVKEDNILILIDSLGNVASSKEVEDAEDKKSVADMSRAKALKSLFRIITPHLNLKNIPMVVINHTYKEIGMYPKDIVSGGTGAYYSSNDIWIIGRQQDKDGKELQGFNFIINIGI